MKKTTLLLALLLAAALPMRASFDFCSNGLYYKITGSYVKVTYPSNASGSSYAWNGYEKPSGPIVIPDIVTNPNTNQSYYVTAVDENTFYQCSDITSVTISGRVTSIGLNAFYQCTSLTSVTFYEPINSYTNITIGQSAFYGCTALSSVTFSNCISTLRSCAFEGCSSLTSITLPANLTTIEAQAFMDCTGLTTIHIPALVSSISSNAFSGCSQLASYTVDDANQHFSAEDGVLYNQNKSQLIRYPYAKTGTSFTIPTSVTVIGESAFNRCANLITIDIPAGVTTIGSNAFFKCTSLSSVTLPEGITTIEGSTFDGCSNLASINIPESVTSIGQYAFNECSSLSSVTIPKNVTTIGKHGFFLCSDLEGVEMTPVTPPSLGQDAFSKNDQSTNNILDDVRFYVPMVGYYNYKNASNNWYSEYKAQLYARLDDATTYQCNNTSTDAPVRYTRTFTPNTWVPLFVPFSSSASDWTDFTIAELSSVTYNDANQTDVLQWNIVAGTVQANHPYIIRYNGSDSYDFDHIFSSCSIATSSLSAPAHFDNTPSIDPRRYTLVGTYDTVRYGDNDTPDQWYAMGGGSFWPAASGNTLLPQRFYLTITDPDKEPGNEGYYKSAPQGGTILRVGEDNVGIIRPDGTLQLPVDDNYYDLLGRRVAQPQKGHIYIHNHKKIIY